MTPVHRSIRLPVPLDNALQALAERQGISAYAMIQRILKTGIADAANPGAKEAMDRELFSELAIVSTRIVDVERLIDRALFTACAAYCYARSAASGVRKSDEAITSEIMAAYERQVRLSQEGRS